MTNKDRNNQWRKVKWINSQKTQNRNRNRNRNKNKRSCNYQNLLEESVFNVNS